MTTQNEDTLSIKELILENQKIIDELNGKLSRKTKEVRIIQEISSEISSTLDLDKILTIILQSMDEVLGFKHSMILFLDEHGEKLKVSASHGYEESGLGAEVPVGQGVIGMVAKRRKIIRMGNIGASMAYISAVKAHMEEGGQEKLGEMIKLPGLENVQSQIGIPLLEKERLIGVFAVESPKPNAFDELDETLLIILANQAASAIDNARLYRAEEERVKELNRAYAELSILNESLEEKVQERTSELSYALEKVNEEQEKSERLLLNVLPKEIAAILKDEDGIIADNFEAVSIMFADVVGFTPLSTKMSPKDMVELLNEIFSYFDSLIEKYELEKIRTIGDNYMVASGVPRPRGDHAHALAGMALEMNSYLHDNSSSKVNGLQFRIGINSGPVVAGIIGRQKFHYDLWGDAVNTASRMESHGVPGKIQVTQMTYELIQDKFICKPRGTIEVKGKGEMDTWFLEGVSS